MTDDPGRTAYYDAASREDEKLEERLTVIRRREDARELTTREAAGQRIAAMEEHLAACRALRKRYFGS